MMPGGLRKGQDSGAWAGSDPEVSSQYGPLGVGEGEGCSLAQGVFEVRVPALTSAVTASR